MAITLDEFNAWLAEKDEEEQNKILGSIFKDYAGDMEKLKRDYARADRYAMTPAPGMYSSGGVTTAASPLEFLGNFAQRGVGEYLRRGADQRLVGGMGPGGQLPGPQAPPTPPPAPPGGGAMLPQLLRGRQQPPWT
jgi:hypothetical protein